MLNEELTQGTNDTSVYNPNSMGFSRVFGDSPGKFWSDAAFAGLGTDVLRMESQPVAARGNLHTTGWAIAEDGARDQTGEKKSVRGYYEKHNLRGCAGFLWA